MSNFEVILCIVNTGFAELVMDTARKLGARGGTIINGRGTASKEAEKIFNITIQPEKEIVMILVSSEIKDGILKGLYDAIGVNTPAQGIAFTLPVDDVVGIGSDKQAK
ncbi:MAG: P-II family nitrogen regulator [Firmicutes bacterium]|nr:P-II family nitrogen regulator [Bacillota bacterium]